MKLSKKGKIRLFICILILIILISLIVLIIKNISKDNGKEKFISTPITLNFESRVDKLASFDSGEFYKFGWLQVQGTNIDVPILDFKTANLLEDIDYSYGWISSGYTTGENRPVLMGHNILNVSSEPMLPNSELKNFEELMAFTYYGQAKDNLYIQYTEDGQDEIYLIYAIGFYDYYYDRAESMTDKDEIKKYIKMVKDNSIYDYDIDVNNNDQLLTIKTCTRYFGLNEKQQFVIDARKLRDNEEIVKYQVKTNDNFKKLNLSEEKS